jgi:hypothetical protein
MSDPKFQHIIEKKRLTKFNYKLSLVLADMKQYQIKIPHDSNSNKSFGYKKASIS